MSDFNGQELSNLAWSISRIAEQSDFRPTLEAIPFSASDGSFRSSDQPYITDWMSALMYASQQRMHALDLEPQGISCILLACTRLQYRPQDAHLRQLCYFSEQRHLRSVGVGAPSVMSPQALSNLMLALAHLCYKPPESFMLAFEAAVISSIKTDTSMRHHLGGKWTSQNLANLIWAMSQLDWTPSLDFTRLHLDLTCAMLPTFQSGDLLQILISLARLKLKVDRSWLELVCIQVGIHSACTKFCAVRLKHLIVLV